MVEQVERLEREEETSLGGLEDLVEERDTNAEGRCRDDDDIPPSLLLSSTSGGAERCGP